MVIPEIGLDDDPINPVIREDTVAKKNPKTQIVFVTSRSDEEFRDQAGRAGASAFITKPFTVSEITLTALAFTLRTRLNQTPCAEPAEPAVA